MVNQKTTAVRNDPVAGRAWARWRASARPDGLRAIMPVNQTSTEAFVTRGGRIPAPIHSFQN